MTDTQANLQQQNIDAYYTDAMVDQDSLYRRYPAERIFFSKYCDKEKPPQDTSLEAVLFAAAKPTPAEDCGP